MRVGLVGCGQWGRLILRDLNSLGCRVAVVARSNESKARAKRGAASEIVEKIASLPPVEGIVVATPTSTHAEVIEEVSSLGTPIFVEKPMTDDAGAAARFAALMPTRLFVMDKWRYHRGVELIAHIARSGELGEVLGLKTVRTQDANPHEDVDTAWILAPHDLAITLEVLGAIPTPRVAVGRAGKDQQETLYALLGDSPWATIEVSSQNPIRRREISLFCTGGTATLADAYDDHLLVLRHNRNPEIEKRRFSNEMPLLLELQAFVEHLNGGPPPKSSAAEGAAIVATIAELRRMARDEN